MGESARVGAAACRTLAIIKPDAVAAGKAEEILHLAELAGFTVIQQQRTQVIAPHAPTYHVLQHRARTAAKGACARTPLQHTVLFLCTPVNACRMPPAHAKAHRIHTS